MAARLMEVQGEVQRSPEGIIHLLAHRIMDRNAVLAHLSDQHPLTSSIARADEALKPIYPRMGHPRAVRLLPKSRDFH
jgi:error-prone DNA polymerase